MTSFCSVPLPEAGSGTAMEKKPKRSKDARNHGAKLGRGWALILLPTPSHCPRVPAFLDGTSTTVGYFFILVRSNSSYDVHRQSQLEYYLLVSIISRGFRSMHPQATRGNTSFEPDLIHAQHGVLEGSSIDQDIRPRPHRFSFRLSVSSRGLTWFEKPGKRHHVYVVGTRALSFIRV
jgi:hypothetical protein